MDAEGPDDSVSKLPGGVIVLSPCARGQIGVCVFDSFSKTVRCSRVVWACRTPFVGDDAGWGAAPPSADGGNNNHNDGGEVGDTTESSEQQEQLSHHHQWLVALLTSLNPTSLTICRPVLLQSGPTTRQLPGGMENIIEHAVHVGASVRLYHPKDHGTVDLLLTQLSALWPEVAATAWHNRLGILDVHNDRPAPNTSLIMALSVMLDVLVRTNQRVVDVREEPPASVVHIDAATLHALRIFRSDAHPCAYQGIGCGLKDGFSLFSIFAAHTTTSFGRELLRLWMLSPTNDVRELRRRQNFITLFSDGACRETSKQLAMALRHVKHPGRTLFRFETMRQSRTDYIDLVRAATALVALRPLLVQIGVVAAERVGGPSSCLGCVSRWIGMIDVAGAARLVDRIRQTLVLTPTNTTGDGGSAGLPAVLPGVDGQLDELRANYLRLSPYLTQVAEELVLSLPQEAYGGWKLSCVFYPRVGYLIAIQCEDEAGRSSHPPRSSGSAAELTPAPSTLPFDWEMVFQAPGVMYCRAPLTRELDSSIGDIHSAVVRRESEVRLGIDEEILALAPCLMPLLHFGSELDVLLAFSSACCSGVEGPWSRPTLIDADNIPQSTGGGGVHFHIEGAQHPLLSRLGTQVVPMGSPFCATSRRGRLGIFTGPNGSGKTIVLQTLALCVYLAHIGCFLPTSSPACVISAVDRIAFISDSSIGSLHTIAAGGGFPQGGRLRNTDGAAKAPVGCSSTTLHASCGGSSSFAMELVAVSRALTQATSRSFIVLDEFGRGTLAADGVAILASFLLSSIVEESPRPTTTTSTSTVVVAANTSPPPPVLLLATHYSEILDSAVGLSTCDLVAHYKMAYVLAAAPATVLPGEEEHEDPSQQAVMFPFQFILSNVEGCVKTPTKDKRVVSSLAINCAVMCGVPDFMISRMTSLLQAREEEEVVAEEWSGSAEVADGAGPEPRTGTVLADVVRILLKRAEGRQWTSSNTGPFQQTGTSTPTSGLEGPLGGVAPPELSAIVSDISAWLARISSTVED